MKKAKNMRTMRHSDTVYPYGPGAMVDILGESFVSPDITEWPSENLQPMKCDRLERELGVSHLKTAPSASDGFKSMGQPMVFWRFPKWRFCQNCGLMSKKMFVKNGITLNLCANCEGKMVPLRYVSVCTLGSHLQDIPWYTWVHRKGGSPRQKNCKDEEHLYMKTDASKGESLSAVGVTCQSCGAKRSFAELNHEKALEDDGFRCFGGQPWVYAVGSRTCEHPLRAVQRGSASLYRAEVVSAIDIPEADSSSESLIGKIRNHGHFKTLCDLSNTPAAEYLAESIAEELGVDKGRVLALASNDLPMVQEVSRNLLSGEWAAFEMAFSDERREESEDFDVVPHTFGANKDTPFALRGLVDEVAGVRRLREVRAIRSFSRYKHEANKISVDLGKRNIPDWYPATEQFGEGIFIKFDEAALRRWETSRSVSDRIAKISQRAAKTYRADDVLNLSPRKVLLHTLAHLLLRRLEFESGYPAASLRERIYAEPDGPDPQAGILVYTGAGDKEGTLGGLVRLAEPHYLGRILLRAIEDADTCSNDPVCGESAGQGLFGLNLAGCHGCVLASETSCENGNVYLDRRLVVGDGSMVDGFFDAVLREARATL